MKTGKKVAAKKVAVKGARVATRDSANGRFLSNDKTEEKKPPVRTKSTGPRLKP